MIALLLTAFAADATGLALEAFTAELEQDRISVPSERVEALHAAACEAGYGPSCDRSWKAGDLQAAGAALEVPCQGGDHAACVVVAWAMTQSEAGKVDAEPARGAEALALFRAACAAGLERGCVEEGVLLTRGVEGEPGLAKAQTLFQTACQVGDLSGCRRLGAMYHNGRGLGRDLEKARQYYGQACDGGYALGCNGLALIDHLGVGVAKDPVAAEANYVKACDAGLKGACDNLGMLYQNGLNPDQDAAAAMAVWASGCSSKVPVACANAGRLANDARLGEARDPAKAGELLQAGCDLGDPFSCGLLGTHLLPTDTERGTGLLENACVQGVAPSCADLADALWSGEHVKKDKKRARDLYTTACQGEFEPACARAK
ncbi:MAG: sel1 repeat family protein [Myxococcales bacterium]|nr:sel1 repeat family protein [Myxococcales bacterium]